MAKVKRGECDIRECESYKLCKAYVTGSKAYVAGFNESDIDMDDMMGHHRMTLAEYFRASRDNKLKELAAAHSRIVQLENELISVKKRAGLVKTPDDRRNEIVADPRNHVEGVCDAIARFGTMWKCAHNVDFNSTMCMVHQNHPHRLAPVLKAEAEIPVVARRIPDSAANATNNATNNAGDNAKNNQNVHSESHRKKKRAQNADRPTPVSNTASPATSSPDDRPLQRSWADIADEV